MVGQTLYDAKLNSQLGEGLDGCCRLSDVHLHFLFFTKPARKEAKILKALLVGIVDSSGALQQVIGRPQPAIGVCCSAAYDRCLFYDHCLQTAVRCP